jgi:hypothetical protein
MGDIASGGRPGPGGEKYHQDDRGPNDGVTKRKAKKKKTAEKEDRMALGFGDECSGSWD